MKLRHPEWEFCHPEWELRLPESELRHPENNLQIDIIKQSLILFIFILLFIKHILYLHKNI